MKCTYLINMDSGRLEFNDQYTIEQANLKPISDDVKDMILRREVTAKDVINAISIKIKESGDFNISDYLENMKKLNVRRANKQVAPEQSNLAEVDDAISIGEVMSAKSKTEPKEDKKARVKKVSEALNSAEMPDIFKS